MDSLITGRYSVPPLPDDFLTMSAKESKECTNNHSTITRVCSTLGVPLKLSKVEGPSTLLTFLGMLLDTNSVEIHLPTQKLQLLLLLHQWHLHKHCSKHELL